MTTKTKQYIELADILALRLTCGHCAAELTMPLTGDISRALHQCPSCKQNWALVEGRFYGEHFVAFATALNTFREILASVPMGCSATIEIAGEKVEP